MKQIIKLVVNHQALDMGNAVVNHTLNNPYLKSRGSYSLPFTIPLTKRNRDILGIAHDIHEFDNEIKIDATLEAGLFSMSGSLIFKESTDPGFLKAHLVSGRGNLFQEAEKIKITELGHEDVIGSGFSLVNDTNFLDAITPSAHGSYPTYNYVFAPIYMPEFPEDDTTEIPQVRTVNYWDVDEMKFVYKSVGASVYGNAYAPFYYVHKVIKEIFGYFGYTIETDEFYNNTELRQSVIFHMNHTDWDAIETVSFAEHLPDMYCSDFLKALETKFNMTFDVNEQNSTVNLRFKKNLLGESIKEDLTQKAEPASVVDFSKYTGFVIEKGVDTEDAFVSDNDPELTLNNNSFDHQEINKEDITSPFVDDLALETGTNKLFRRGHQYGVGVVWLDAGQAVSDYNKESGDNDLDVTVDAYHLLIYEPDPALEDAKLITRSDHSRYFQIIKDKKPKPYDKLAITIFRGMAPYNCVESASDLPDFLGGSLMDGTRYYVFDENKTYLYHDTGYGGYDWEVESNGLGDYNQYPFLSSSRYYLLSNSEKREIAGTSINLNLFGSDGMYINFFKDWLYWYVYLRKVEKRVIHYSHESFMSLRWDQKYRIKEQNYLVASIPLKLDFENQRIVFGESELHSIH